MPPTASAIVAVLQAAPAPTAMSSLIQMVPFLMFVGILVSVVAFVKRYLISGPAWTKRLRSCTVS